MSGRHGSTVFLATDDVIRVEAMVQLLLDEEGFTYGAMRRVPIATISGGADGWTLLVAEPPFDFSDLASDGTPRLARLAAMLECEGAQLDASDDSAGLLEVNAAGSWLLSGLLRRWNSGEEPDVTDTGTAAWVQRRDLFRELRTLLRRPDADPTACSDAVDQLALRVGGRGFDPREPEAFVDNEGSQIAFKVRTKHGTR